jgi:hypothetical protein
LRTAFSPAGVPALPHLLVIFAGDRAGLLGLDGRCPPQHHPALLAADLVLEDPGPRPAVPDPKAETGNVVVEFDVIQLALRERKIDGLGGQSHGQMPTGKIMGRSERRSPGVLATSLYCWYEPFF